jgi:hypothetical protein
VISKAYLYETWNGHEPTAYSSRLERSHRSFSSEGNFSTRRGSSVQLQTATGPLNFCVQQFICIFLFLFVGGGQLELRRHSIFLRRRHILQLPVVRGWNPPADFWVAGVRFAITLPASSHSVLNIGFQGVVGSSRALCPHISIVMSVLCVVSVFCRGGAAASVCRSLLSICYWGEGSYGCDSEVGAKASPVSVTAPWRRIQGVKISPFILNLGIRIVVTITLRPYMWLFFWYFCASWSRQYCLSLLLWSFILSVGVPEFLHSFNLYFMLFWDI